MIKRFWVWLRPTLEDDNGQASYRRMTALVFTFLICYMVVTDYIQTVIQLNAFYSLLVAILLLIGIITTQNIITFIKGYNSNSSNKDSEPTIKD